MEREVGSVTASHRIGRIGDVIFIKLVIAFVTQQVDDTLPFGIEHIDIKPHSWLEQGGRIITEYFGYLLVTDIAFKRLDAIGLACAYPIG